MDRLLAWVMWIANRGFNYRSWFSGPRVTLDKLERGGVRLLLSVLLVPKDELDIGAPPQRSYFDDLLEQLERVERCLARQDPHRKRHVIVHSAADLQDRSRVAFAHSVEGGFHLGATEHEVKQNVAKLARRGVVSIILAHLFWRHVATNAPAIPFLTDRWYERLFQQPNEGLSDLGRAAVEAMYQEKVLIDLSHMSERSIKDCLDLLDQLDPEAQFPVIASHTGIRFERSTQEYLLSENTVKRIARRDGVVGLILAQHQLNDGVRRTRTRRLRQSVDVICRHIDRIDAVAGTGHVVALGTDLDGFIKPTLSGLQTAADLKKLRHPLMRRYRDAAKVDGFLYGNAERVIRRALDARGPATGPTGPAPTGPAPTAPKPV